ncbi:MetQ/NlpA family ABC transporter substrate-binding protein [Staphylococcus coagulans]|uniref:MetQ/NlpA family ABC transporter substrate-binding protein n=1 Tax=Staphylococcus coagulans TaxID=74706 RepID=UPI001F4BCDF4|nr:MetQ/NlpA family ABC transporter substrate-binding protein [Staphylococcus coagulans]UNB49352.1 MetQ/NlpA family ABC transporter substrate-binding protein [Staphylococcus coagulans]
MKRFFYVLILGFIVISVAGCGKSDSESNSDKKFTIGFGVGTYEEQFRKGILPILQKEGYDVKIKTFSQNDQVDPALVDEEIDATVHQSRAYMNSMNKKLNGEMIVNNHVPTAPQSIWSTKHHSLDDVKDGQTIAVPNDPVNQERAFRILEKLKWVKIDKDAGTVNFNVKSVKPDRYHLNFKEVHSAQVLRSLDDVDYGIVNGNYIADAHKVIADGLIVEKTPEQHKVVLTINKKDQNKAWAKALKKAYYSDEFKTWYEKQNKYKGFITPKEWNEG